MFPPKPLLFLNALLPYDKQLNRAEQRPVNDNLSAFGSNVACLYPVGGLLGRSEVRMRPSRVAVDKVRGASPNPKLIATVIEGEEAYKLSGYVGGNRER